MYPGTVWHSNFTQYLSIDLNLKPPQEPYFHDWDKYWLTILPEINALIERGGSGMDVIYLSHHATSQHDGDTTRTTTTIRLSHRKTRSEASSSSIPVWSWLTTNDESSAFLNRSLGSLSMGSYCTISSTMPFFVDVTLFDLVSRGTQYVKLSYLGGANHY